MGWSIFRCIWRRKGVAGSRAMSSCSRRSPWLMLGSAVESEQYMMYNLAEQKVMRFKKQREPVQLVGSSHGWLASFNRDSQQMFLSDPITARRINLPDIGTLPETPFYRDPRTLILTSSPEAQECRAVITFGPNSRMAVCTPGRSTAWITVGDQVDYHNIAYSAALKRLFCVTWGNEAECWDLHVGPSPSIVWKDHLSNLDKAEDDDDNDDAVDMRWQRQCLTRYLVPDDHSGRLFVVTRHVMDRVGRDGSYAKIILLPQYGGPDLFYPHKTLGFDVHEIDYTRGKSRYMDYSLDGLAMFVGNNHSFALPVGPDFPELSPDSIYFTDDHLELGSDANYGYGGHDIGIYNYAHRTLSSIYYSSRVSDITYIPPTLWFTPTH